MELQHLCVALPSRTPPINNNFVQASIFYRSVAFLVLDRRWLPRGKRLPAHVAARTCVARQHILLLAHKGNRAYNEEQSHSNSFKVRAEAGGDVMPDGKGSGSAPQRRAPALCLHCASVTSERQLC